MENTLTNRLKGLDTVRALAAMVVLFGHVELLKQRAHLPNLIDANFSVFPDGHIAVILFFILSGFIITYKLVQEQTNTNTISYKNFIIRRILRIWPLYYLVLILSFFLIEADYSISNVLLSVSIFPNVAQALNMGWEASPQIWSIGVEEQFYLFWPLVLLFLPSKHIVKFLIVFFIGYTLLPHVIGYLNVHYWQHQGVTSFVGNFFNDTKFNCIAIGALFGYFLAKKKHWPQVFAKPMIFYCFAITSTVLWFLKVEIPFFTDEFYAVLFAISLYGLVQQRFSIDNRITIFLGEISYGIYMYHWLIIVLLLHFIPKNENIGLYNAMLYGSVVLLTIGVSCISRYTVEKYFLNLKKRFR